MSRPRPATAFVYDRQQMIATPDAVFDGLRAEGDLLWSGSMRRWLVLSRALALDVLRDPAFRVHDLFANFNVIEDRTGVDLADLKRVSGWIPFLHDGPRHAALREGFSRLLADLRPDYLVAFREASARLLRDMADAGEGDLASDYADRLHAETLGALGGFAPEDRLWLAQTTGSQGSIDFAASVREMIDVNARGGDILARLDRMTTSPDAAPLMARIGRAITAAQVPDTREHRLECLTALLLLGRDTLAGTLTLGLAHLLEAGGGVLRGEAAEVDGAFVDEILRLSSAVQIVLRVATRDLELGGHRIAAGEMVMIFPQACNRDPAAFRCPHGIDRQQTGHLAFGSARHLCSGLRLSREALGIALSQILSHTVIEARPGAVLDTGRNTRKFKALPVSLRTLP